MKYSTNALTLQEKVKEELPKATQRTKKQFVHSLEYELIAGLALQQYIKDEEADFQLLLSIPLSERIPGFIREYGLKRIHQLIKLLVKEFYSTPPLHKIKKPNETKLAFCACEIMLAAMEDQLSIEDLIIFLELTQKGKYGSFKGIVPHSIVTEKLEDYRQERFEAYISLKGQMHQHQKNLGPSERINGGPVSMQQLLNEQDWSIIPLKKIS
ncbi:hypothetical protein [Flavisolibacter ginsengisoli]|jgi:hypothetical protein|uniref:Uncharacterized protein n=1 Tax=Flavisolibacter ginsengisoli DSM 18119 TaxID=1121884 RepID=A0A1M4U9T1_9BACT|nr:hypothetical protein [Flavisolibacter ginsengisoli]SHE53396.1 hypothetical protein SAMN02745131_00573 [Flavisolibacter ginsengisoli DSM 18119]